VPEGTLPENAPADAQDAPPVGEPAPASEGAVEEGSGHEDVVPAARFNGLMGAYQKLKNEQDARIAALQAELDAVRTQQPKEETPVVSDASTTAAEVAALKEMLLQERLDAAKARALQEHPEAAPFADLIVANSPEEVRDLAKTIADRVKSAFAASAPAPASGEPAPQGEPAPATPAAPADASSEAPAPAAPAAPVVGGAATVPGDLNPNERLKQAIANRDFAGYLQAKFEMAAQAPAE